MVTVNTNLKIKVECWDSYECKKKKMGEVGFFFLLEKASSFTFSCQPEGRFVLCFMRWFLICTIHIHFRALINAPNYALGWCKICSIRQVEGVHKKLKMWKAGKLTSKDQQDLQCSSATLRAKRWNNSHLTFITLPWSAMKMFRRLHHPNPKGPRLSPS